jgi:ribonuclease HII
MAEAGVATHPGTCLRCSWEIETAARAVGFEVVAGVDEVGRGALCGPVFAGAVILGEGFDASGIDDSKRLTAKRREVLTARIRGACRACALGAADAAEIDRLGIVAATHLAMRRAVEGLALHPDLLLVDGLSVPDVPIERWPIVKGDARSFSIAAAAIVAKVARDELLRQLNSEYPGYGLARNKGYGSLEHRQALESQGLSALHRRTFCHSQLSLLEDTRSVHTRRSQGDELR